MENTTNTPEAITTTPAPVDTAEFIPTRPKGVVLYDIVRLCPGGKHAIFNSSVGLVRKPVRLARQEEIPNESPEVTQI